MRTSNEAAPEQWVGYAAADAIIFAKSDLSGEDILTLSLNEEVTVLDAFGDLLFVRNADGFEGYVPADKIMREKVEEPEAEAGYAASPSGSSGYAGGSSGSGSGSTGGGSGSGGAGSGSGGSADGGGSGSGSGGGSNSGSGGSAGGGSSSDGSGSGSDGSGSSGSGTPSTPGDGEEVPLPTNFMEGFDLFRLGVGVAYADEPADAVVADAAATHAVGAADAAGSADAAGAVPESDVTAVVLASDVQTYEGMFNRGDEVVVKLGADTAADGADAAGGSVGASDGVSGGDAPSDASASADDADGGASPTAETGGPSGEAGIWDDAPELSAEEKAEKGAEVDAEPTCTVLLNGREVSLPAKLLRLETDDPYQPWSGFALEGACLFEDYQLTRQSAQLAPGDELAVIDAAGSVLIVERDGDAVLHRRIPRGHGAGGRIRTVRCRGRPGGLPGVFARPVFKFGFGQWLVVVLGRRVGFGFRFRGRFRFRRLVGVCTLHGRRIDLGRVGRQRLVGVFGRVFRRRIRRRGYGHRGRGFRRRGVDASETVSAVGRNECGMR